MMLGTAFGILGILLSGGLAFKAIQLTVLASNGVGLPPEMIAGGTAVDAMGLGSYRCHSYSDRYIWLATCQSPLLSLSGWQT